MTTLCKKGECDVQNGSAFINVAALASLQPLAVLK